MQGSFLLQETRNLKNVTVGKNEGFAGRKCDEFFVSDIVDDFFLTPLRKRGKNIIYLTSIKGTLFPEQSNVLRLGN